MVEVPEIVSEKCCMSGALQTPTKSDSSLADGNMVLLQNYKFVRS